MNIAFISNVVYPYVKGGAEKRIHEIGSRLAADGHEVTVYTRQYWEGSTETEESGMHLVGVAPSHDLYTGTDERRSISEAIGFAAAVFRPLNQNVDQHDVVVASVFPYFPVVAAKLTVALDDTPLVVTWHEVWREYWEEYLGHLAPFGKGVERVVANLPHQSVAVSKVTADRLAGIAPSHRQTEIVHNGIDIDRVRRLDPAESGYDVVYAGRLIPAKNVDLIIDAFDKLAAEYDMSLGIIGDGPEAERVQRAARSAEHSNRIDLLGFLEEYEDVLRHMRAADTFVSPSVREGFGITYVEAMAAGCVVVGADHERSAAADVIGDAGYVVDPSVESLSAVLERIFAGESPPVNPSTAAESFDWDTIKSEALSVYRGAVRNS